MKTTTKIIIYLILLALIDTFIPVPILAIILLYVVIERPAWFKSFVSEIYDPPPDR